MGESHMASGKHKTTVNTSFRDMNWSEKYASILQQKNRKLHKRPKNSKLHVYDIWNEFSNYNRIMYLVVCENRIG